MEERANLLPKPWLLLSTHLINRQHEFIMNMRNICLLFLQIYLQYVLSHKLSPKTTLDHFKSSIGKSLPYISLTTILSTVRPRSSLGDDVKRQMEYMPALQGLDYGKASHEPHIYFVLINAQPMSPHSLRRCRSHSGSR